MGGMGTSAGLMVVTGATGNVGRAVVDGLIARGRSVRVCDRHADDDVPPVERVRLDFTDPSTFAPALLDATSVFVIRPPAISKVGPTINRFIDVAVEAGVEHVVFSSVAGAESNSVIPHHKIEQHLFGSGIEWTVLRPGFFAQNIGGAYRDDIVNDDRIFLPSGRGLVAFIDARDIGEVAAEAMADPKYRGEALHLTGPQAVTFDEVAAKLTSLVGRSIRYEPTSVPLYFGHLLKQRLPVMQAVVQTILHRGYATVTPKPSPRRSSECWAGHHGRSTSTSLTMPPAGNRPSSQRRRGSAPATARPRRSRCRVPGKGGVAPLCVSRYGSVQPSVPLENGRTWGWEAAKQG